MRILAAALALLSLVILFMPLSAMAEKEATLMVVSDLHYLARELYAGSDLFLRALQAGDGKITQYSDELMSALCEEAGRVRPDALIVTGDLSFNGEKLSHAALADWFSRIEEAGVPVWVIPGNHDINVPSPIGYANGMVYRTEGVTEQEFAALYADFMEPPTEGANFSYMVKINDAWRVAMTDAAYYRDEAQTFGLFSAGHASWLESALRDATAAGAHTVTASHHSLIAHTEFAKENFLMFGHEAMDALARQYGVRLNLSGHLHIQHIAREGDLADAALGAFCMWPHRYALVTLGSDGSIAYEARQLGPDSLPEGFLEESKAWFTDIAQAKVSASLASLGLAAEEASAMADYAARFNLAYFSGVYRRDDSAWTRDPAYALWRQHGDLPFFLYMNLVMNEATQDNLSL